MELRQTEASEEILKLADVARKESLVMEVTLEGLLSIQAGEHPQMIREKIQSILEQTDK